MASYNPFTMYENFVQNLIPSKSFPQQKKKKKNLPPGPNSKIKAATLPSLTSGLLRSVEREVYGTSA